MIHQNHSGQGSPKNLKKINTFKSTGANGSIKTKNKKKDKKVSETLILPKCKVIFYLIKDFNFGNMGGMGGMPGMGGMGGM